MKNTVLLLLLIWCCQPTWLTAQIVGNGVTPQVTVTTSDNNQNTGNTTLNTGGLLPNLPAASRFLAQATLGSNIEAIEATAEQGLSNWLDQQLNMPVQLILEDSVRNMRLELAQQKFAIEGDSSNSKARLKHFHSAWWQQIMDSPDVVRARVALAFSEIMVISEIPNLEDHVLGLADYYEVLHQHGLGNFKDLLQAVTYHPTMGVYLTYMNNPPSDEPNNIFPDENYAREVMQLFTIGLHELNLDGTRKLQNGEPIPTYGIDDIGEFAKVFTGMTWGDAVEFGKKPRSEYSYATPMKMIESEHEPGVKNLLNGETADGSSGTNDIEAALQNLFDHSNVGPFIGYRLIQRLVKSNPTPAYVRRVAMAFNDNGQGVRGDLKAVVRAVLMDSEARDCAWIEDPTNGMLREPIVRNTHIARAFDAASAAGHYHTTMSEYYFATSQRPLSSPSVFNFFQVDFTPIGGIEDAGLVAPVFQILNSSTALTYGNEINEWTFKRGMAIQPTNIYREAVTQNDYIYFDWTEERALVVAGEISKLVERLNLILMHGRMSESTRSIIENAVLQVPESQTDYRLEMAVYLVMISPEYLIFR